MTKKQIAQLLVEYVEAHQSCCIHRSYRLRGELWKWAQEELSKKELASVVERECVPAVQSH